MKRDNKEFPYNGNRHKQLTVNFKVDKKMVPVIKFIMKRYPSLIPFASCKGGKKGSCDCYIALIVRDMSQFHHMCRFFSIEYAQYQLPDPELGNVPSWRISIKNLDEIISRIKK